MVDATINQELSTYLNQLPVEQQRQVLNFARSLTEPSRKGVPGATLLQCAGAIDAADLDEMTRAIEAGCERIDADEW